LNNEPTNQSINHVALGLDLTKKDTNKQTNKERTLVVSQSVFRKAALSFDPFVGAEIKPIRRMNSDDS